MNKPTVTVIIPTFNHGNFIEQTIHSVVSQSIFDDCIVVVSDDSSQDDTFEIAKRISRKFSNVIVSKNRKNLGIIPHYRSLTKTITTPFLAILEGDDYWISNRKIEQQRDFLQVFSDVGMCFSAYCVQDETSGAKWQQPGWSRNCIVPVVDLIQTNPVGSFSNCFYRTERFRRAINTPGAINGYDWLVNLLIAMDGGIGYIAEVSTLYRLHLNGTWTSLSSEQKKDGILATLNELKRNAPKGIAMFIDAAIEKAA